MFLPLSVLSFFITTFCTGSLFSSLNGLLASAAMLNMRPRVLIQSLNRFPKYSTFPESSTALEELCPEEKRHVTPENQHELLSDTVTPLAKMDYVEQLKFKKDWSYNVLKMIKALKIPKVKTTMHTIIPSPIIDNYRNKDEFCIRTGVDGDPKTVGFFIGSPAKGKVVCVEPTHLRIIKPRHRKVAKVFQDLVRESPLKACHDLHDGGFWRSVIVRSNVQGETMVVIHCHPAGASSQELENAKAQIKEHFQDHDVSSIYFQLSPHTRATHEKVPYELLHGEPHIYERLGEYQFRISPDSFFQVNVEAAPLLYDRALQFTSPAQRSTLLDLCCGTGTVSIIASKLFRGCYGIDSVSQAIDDAHFNASANHVFNCYFQVGLIERSLGKALAELDMVPELSAILNPGRSGCNKHAIKALRKSQQIRNIVFISCKADHPNIKKNIVQLCHQPFDDSPPFRLTDVQPVDMFPQTSHCELIMVFRR